MRGRGDSAPYLLKIESESAFETEEERLFCANALRLTAGEPVLHIRVKVDGHMLSETEFHSEPEVKSILQTLDSLGTDRTGTLLIDVPGVAHGLFRTSAGGKIELDTPSLENVIINMKRHSDILHPVCKPA